MLGPMSVSFRMPSIAHRPSSIHISPSSTPHGPSAFFRLLKHHIRRAGHAVLAAAEVVAVAREPAVELVGEVAHQGNPEYPRDPSASRQDVEQTLNCCRA